MRTNGVAARLCTGGADGSEKVDAWAAIEPHAIDNPMYYWTHLALCQPFGTTGTLPLLATAEAIRQHPAGARQLPCARHYAADEDENGWYYRRSDRRQASAGGLPTTATATSRCRPSCRLDKAFHVGAPSCNKYLQRLEAAADVSIGRFSVLCGALRKHMV